MIIIQRGRRGGKTIEAVNWVKAEPGRVLLVINEMERRRVIREFSLDPKQVVNASPDLHRLRGRHVKIGVDNWDLLDFPTRRALDKFLPDIELITETI